MSCVLWGGCRDHHNLIAKNALLRPRCLKSQGLLVAELILEIGSFVEFLLSASVMNKKEQEGHYCASAIL